jgi:hypothetical protein
LKQPLLKFNSFTKENALRDSHAGQKYSLYEPLNFNMDCSIFQKSGVKMV